MKNGSTNTALPYKLGYLYTRSRLPPTLCACRRRGGSVVRRCSSQTHTCTSHCPDILTRSSRPWHVPRWEAVHTSLLKKIQSKHIKLQCCESSSYYILFYAIIEDKPKHWWWSTRLFCGKQTVRTHIIMLIAVM